MDLTESTIQANARFFDKPEDVPTQAYTMGIGTIMRAKRILLIASGKGKAAIVKKLSSDRFVLRYRLPSFSFTRT